MSETEIKIARCDPYPAIEPQGYVVGFIVYCKKNGKSMYRDVLVSFAELARAEATESDKEGDVIVDMAYSKIKDAVKIWCDTVSSSPVILGSVYTPKQ